MIHLGTSEVYAQTTYTLLEPTGGTKSVGPGSYSGYFTSVYQSLLVLTVALAVIMIVLGGIQYSASWSSPSAKGEGKSKIISAIGGLLLALLSYIILRTINPALLATPIFLR